MRQVAAQLFDQPELDLGLPTGASPSLREAYELTDLQRFGIPFERAVQTPHIRLCLTRVAEQRAAARKAA